MHKEEKEIFTICIFLIIIIILLILWVSNILIELVYYQPYQSEYNMIERYLIRLRLSWNRLIINTIDKLIESINKVTWKDVKTWAKLITKEYKKGISINKDEIKTVEKMHVSREKV